MDNSVKNCQSCGIPLDKMNKRIVINYTIITFAIMLIACGMLIVFGHFGFTLEKHFWLYIPFIFGGFSPAIASYIVLKKNHGVKSFKEWIKNVFAVKSSIRFYFLVLLLSIVYFISQILIGGLEQMNPIWMFFVLLPLMPLGGGMEEAGWRYILQPELEKKYGYIISAIIVAVIWSLWHLPIFFVPGTNQYGTNFLLYAIDIVGLTFALGAIRKISNSVFLCVLFHCIHNAGSVTFNLEDTLLGNVITSCLLIIVSIIVVLLHKKRERIENREKASR